jgi:hypothetical protein
LALLVVPPSTATLNAWLMPAPPGVTETLLEIELEAVTATTEWNVTGIEYAAMKTATIPRRAM